MTDRTIFRAIASTAEHLLKYRVAAKKLQNAECRRTEANVNGIKYGGWLVRHELGLSYAECDKFHAERLKLIEFLKAWTPNAREAFRTVIEAGSWHAHGVDWDKAEKELRAIMEEAQRAKADPATSDDPYIPARACLDHRIKSHKQLLKVLRENPQIRSQHPRPQRLEVHAADLIRWKQKQADAKWNAADTDAVMEAVENQKDDRKQKRRGSTAGITALAKKITAKTH